MDLDGGRCLFLVSAILLSSLIEFIAECRYSIDAKLANGIYSLHKANGPTLGDHCPYMGMSSFCSNHLVPNLVAI